MIIAVPTIDKKRHFPVISALYDAMAQDYNEKVKDERKNGDYSRNPLRSTHRELYFALVNIAFGRMEQNIYTFRSLTTMTYLQMDSRQPYKIETSRKQLFQRTIKSEASIYRQLNRLLDAGILLRKTNHGPTRPFDLYINPDILPISDEINELFDPIADILATSENQIVTSALRSFCTEYSINQNILNNRVIPERQKVKAELSLDQTEHTGTNYQNTESTTVSIPCSTSGAVITKINEFRNKDISSLSQDELMRHIDEYLALPEEIKHPQKNQSTADSQMKNAFGMIVTVSEDDRKRAETEYGVKMQQLRTSEEQRKMKFAMLLVEFMLQHLFASRNIFRGEIEKAYKMAEWYFEKISIDNGACNSALEAYKERIRLVERYLERHKYRFDFSNIYPAHYLDPENVTSGFIRTEKWLKDSEKFKRMKQRAMLRKTDDQKYQYALAGFMKYSNLSAYQYWRAYVVNKIPSRVADYDRAAASIVKNLNS